MSKTMLTLCALSLLPIGFVRWVSTGGMDPVETQEQGIVRSREKQTVRHERRCSRVSRRRVKCEEVPVPPYDVEVYDVVIAGRDEHLTGTQVASDPSQFEIGDRVVLAISEVGLPFVKRRFVEKMSSFSP